MWNIYIFRWFTIFFCEFSVIFELRVKRDLRNLEKMHSIKSFQFSYSEQLYEMDKTSLTYSIKQYLKKKMFCCISTYICLYTRMLFNQDYRRLILDTRHLQIVFLSFFYVFLEARHMRSKYLFLSYHMYMLMIGQE